MLGRDSQSERLVAFGGTSLELVASGQWLRFGYRYGSLQLTTK